MPEGGGGPESHREFTKIKMLQKIKIIIIIIIVVVVNRVRQLPPCTVVCILAPRQSILLLPPRLLAPPRADAPRRGPAVGPGSGTQAAADAAPGARALHARTVGVKQGNPKTKRAGGVSRFAGSVRASMERHGARPLAGRSLEKKRRMLKARPRVSGLQKLRTTKLNTKGRISARASHPLSGAGPWRSPRRAAPCRAVGFVSLPPSRRQTARDETRGAAAPRARRSRAPASAACPGCSSHLVVDVGWALGGHLLDNVDGVPVVPAHLLVVRAVVVLCSP